MTFRRAIAALLLVATLAPIGIAASKSEAPKITVRTEEYPRPPYSYATYYIYEKAGTPICTKIEVCNKYDECESSYHPGRYKTAKDQKIRKPYGSSPATLIAPGKLGKHVCLVRYKLAGS